MSKNIIKTSKGDKTYAKNTIGNTDGKILNPKNLYFEKYHVK